MENKNEILKCKNCGSSIEGNSKYCQNCGQKLSDKKVSFKDLVIDFFSTFFILDFKFFQSIKAMFIPGKITLDYFKGKHGSYSSPWRLFFVSAIIMLVVVGFDSKINRPNPENENIKNNIFKFNNLKFYKTEGFNFQLDTIPEQPEQKFSIDSIKNRLTNQEYIHIKKLYTSFDTAYKYSDKNVKYLLDSSVYVMNALLKDIYYDSISIFDTKVSKYDLKNYSIFELREKYKAKKDTSIYDGLLDKFIYNQNTKNFDTDKLIDFLVKNLNWFIVFLLPFAALIFKFLYIRRKRFLVEHLVFNLHNHTAILFIYSLYTILAWLNLDFIEKFQVFIIIFLPLLYYLFSIKKYYNQSWRKSIFKTLLFIILYSFTMFIIGIAYILIAAISLYTIF